MIIAALVIVVFVAGFIVHREYFSVSRELASINGEPITVHEFKFNMEQKRAEVYAYFKSKYNAEYGPEFWDKNFGSEIPGEKIKKDTLETCIRIKVQQTLAKKQGIVKDISFSGVANSLKDENKRRKKAIDKNEVIYGNSSFNMDEYYAKLMDDTINELKKSMSKNFNITEKQIEEYYSANKEKFIAQEKTIKIDKLSISYLGSNMSKPEIKERLGEIREKVQKGLELGEAARLLGDELNNKVHYETRVLDSESARSDIINNPVLLEKASQLMIGDISNVFEEGGALSIIKCTNVFTIENDELAKVKKVIEKKLIDAEYEKMIDKMAADAVVEVNEKVYNGLKVE